uniref:Uncharacterized protein n=1 Tax=Kwoniella pini CBS 10737 TaxID=1296096 RepID=A0A1B9I3A2_9TREE|nr:uncharacterized protein I206_04525 [Kwoniella pini CBS 10737]OCF49994.1 hypothetical protein I206_04525 [Kwoniella pini CBS 10737]
MPAPWQIGGQKVLVDLGDYRNQPVFSEDDNEDVSSMQDPSKKLETHPIDPLAEPRCTIQTVPETTIVTPFTHPNTLASTSPPIDGSLRFDFEVFAGIQRLAGSFLSKYPEWQRNIYKTIYTADPDIRVQLPEYLEIKDIQEILYHLPKILFKGNSATQRSTIPIAYDYDIHTAVIRLLAHNVPALPKMKDPYNTPIQRPGRRRHYFDTITLHFGPYSVQRDGVLIDPERVHLRWVHECLSWVVCEVLEGEGHPQRILQLLDAQVGLLLELKDINGIRMVTRARIDCADQGCPLHCDYTRIFTGIIAIVVVTAERACLQAYRSSSWEELDKRRKVFYEALKVAAKLLDCNSVNLSRTLERLNNPTNPTDYGVIQKEHDDIEREFLRPEGAYWQLSEKSSGRAGILPCNELFSIPKEEMKNSEALKRWEGFVGDDYYRDEPIRIPEMYLTDLDTMLKGSVKRVRGIW